ncbi:hypothetical protein M758_6G193600 [Ceratodon purpureus]|nr:hypothetical protein M758_6G193600 [Ceratodon purpureus]
MPWPMLLWDQCILGVALPVHFEEFSKVWSLIRGVVLWTSWLQRNQALFHNSRWPPDVLERTVWDAIIDLAPMANERVEWAQHNLPQNAPSAQRDFESVWHHRGVFFTATDSGIHWNYQRPLTGQFIAR